MRKRTVPGSPRSARGGAGSARSGRKGAGSARAGRGGATIRIAPATADRWDDLEQLFGPRGACAGCWCMWWRLRRAEWGKGKGDGNRRALRALVQSGEPTGLVAYLGRDPIAWIAVAPRGAYPGLERSRTLKPEEAGHRPAAREHRTEAFRNAGFVEVARRSETRPIMRRELGPEKRTTRGRTTARA